VAVTINKTPMPFANKVNRLEKLEPNAIQSADPNKPLYGNKAAVREAARDMAKETSEPAAVQAVEKKTDGKAAIIDLSAADKPKRSDVKTIDVRSADAEAKADGVDDKWSYYLQAGAFREVADAENTRAKLALMGIEAKVSERQSENGTLYRVRVGPFGQIETMNRMRGKLTDNGVDVAVVRVAK
jgi:cell division protein FtsN